MFDAKSIGDVIGRQSFDKIQKSDLPKIETMTLLQIWTNSSPRGLRALAEADELLPVLIGMYGSALDHACDLRIDCPHLTQTECLQAAGLPMRL